ncbi:hypothetical protein [Pseudofulvimonas gallinarii]|jgi:hypothetical protein|uniref:Uncharacterized protein n=1 Tax=Pseudofulvimonas gallinarii TaxID=634155 RepID=A0A4R3L259_9GAMM|nr:hypothetical protein [Pseudofulvimonas gallinarii]TCS93529.1 hypothetical protein EDC25_12725 [Pseudofulvimonas gallinarii]
MNIQQSGSFPPRDLRCLLDADPPAQLRRDILRKVRRRRSLRRLVPAAAVAALLMMAAVPWRLQPDSTHSDWQRRSAQLEAVWRESDDPQWLREDARAQRLLRQLRQVDQALDQAYAQALDASLRDQLWRQRTEALSALILSRRQGGVAVQL